MVIYTRQARPLRLKNDDYYIRMYLIFKNDDYYIRMYFCYTFEN